MFVTIILHLTPSVSEWSSLTLSDLNAVSEANRNFQTGLYNKMIVNIIFWWVVNARLLYTCRHKVECGIVLVALYIITRCLFPLTDVIWVILSVEVGGLLGVTQQLSSFQAEFSTQPHRRLEGDYNPFASPEKSKCPNSNSLHDAGGHRVAEEHWQGSPNELQQDQNGLSHNSVDIVANSLQSNLSVVSYNQVRHIKGQGDSPY